MRYINKLFLILSLTLMAQIGHAVGTLEAIFQDLCKNIEGNLDFKYRLRGTTIKEVLDKIGINEKTAMQGLENLSKKLLLDTDLKNNLLNNNKVIGSILNFAAHGCKNFGSGNVYAYNKDFLLTYQELTEREAKDPFLFEYRALDKDGNVVTLQVTLYGMINTLLKVADNLWAQKPASKIFQANYDALLNELKYEQLVHITKNLIAYIKKSVSLTEVLNILIKAIEENKLDGGWVDSKLDDMRSSKANN